MWPVSTSYPQYKPAFNQAAAAYELAFDAYATFRSAPSNQPQVAIAIQNLTVSIVDLENSFQQQKWVHLSDLVRRSSNRCRLS